MATKTKILIGILITIIIVISGRWWTWQRIISVITEKTEYERNEEVIITVKTDPYRSIYYSGTGGGGCYIRQKVGGLWDMSYIISLVPYYEGRNIEAYRGKYREIGSNKTFSYRWNQKRTKWSSNEEYLASPGVYRVTCLYYPYPWKCIIGIGADCIIDNLANIEEYHSEEFRIKARTSEEIKLEKCINFSEVTERENCIKTLALEKKDEYLCQYLQPKESKEVECRVFIKMADKEISCDKEKKECIEKIAIETGEIKACDFLQDEKDRKECYIAVSINKNDLGICKKLGSYTFTEWCYTGIAVKRNDPRICDEMEHDYEYLDKDACLMDLAVSTGNLDYCKMIRKWSAFNECLYRIAINKNDPKICQYIDENSYFREKCHGEFRASY